MSQKLKLDEFDAEKIVKGFFIAAAGAALTYLIDVIPTVDFGMWTPLVVVANSTLVNGLRKFLMGW